MWFMVIGFAGAFLTAAYMTRCIYLTFFGEYRGGHSHEGELEHDAHVTAHEVEVEHAEEHAHAGPHESGPLLTVPLIILAVLSDRRRLPQLGRMAVPLEKFGEWFEPTTGQPDLEHATFAYGKAALSMLLVICAIAFVAYLMANDFAFLKTSRDSDKVARAGYTFLENKYYLDCLYENIIVAGISGPIARALLGQPERHRRDREPDGHHDARRRQLRLQARRPGVVDRGVNGAGEAAEERAASSVAAVRQGPAVRRASVRRGRHRGAGPRDHRLGAESR